MATDDGGRPPPSTATERLGGHLLTACGLVCGAWLAALGMHHHSGGLHLPLLTWAWLLGGLGALTLAALRLRRPGRFGPTLALLLAAGLSGVAIEQLLAAAAAPRDGTRRTLAAAQRGDPSAMFQWAAYLYQAGNRAEAVPWLEKAAEAGHAEAREALKSIAREGP